MFLRFILQVAALMTAVHWVVHGGARDALEYQVSQERLDQESASTNQLLQLMRKHDAVKSLNSLLLQWQRDSLHRSGQSITH